MRRFRIRLRMITFVLVVAHTQCSIWELLPDGTM